ncbi:MATE family efflux transporter [Methanosphaera sp. ISO3-F5]|uniref:MATE family efflux transporter n=1 Tax=Methanosphaera sp. ISO3-F5 TaxID=1452353 RepID=UPI002B25FF44|nr:MATE family efflux transporter [Methanosphaera sp. ISO3-F5]WQH65319.1 MATE family efflux transporter [Methanosphaera sp. ISO3-F5]
MSIPLIISMLLVSIYNLADAAWVAGLGSDALAGVGFVTPLFLILVGLGNGLGGGATSALSKYIGQQRKDKADNGGLHVIILTTIISLIITVLLLLALKPLVTMMGAGNTLNYALDYGQIMFAGSILFVLPNAMYGILRAEGDVNRTMVAMAISGILNIIIDPIFIYTLNLGVKGAALATLLSSALVILIISYWFYIKKDTYIKPTKTNFKFSKKISYDILKVGIPASLELLLTSILITVLSTILTMVASTDAVAVYSTGWRVVSLGTMPIIGISTALVSIVGANYGAKQLENIKLAHRYSMRLALLIAILTGAIIYIFAPQIVVLFSYSAGSAHLAGTMTDFLRNMTLYYLFMAFGAPSTFLFQGVGKGLTAMVQTLLRNVVFSILCAYLFALVLGMGEHGVWYGIVVGQIIASIVTTIWANTYINRLIRLNT